MRNIFSLSLVVLVVMVLLSCDEDKMVDPRPPGEPEPIYLGTIRDCEYLKNRFFSLFYPGEMEPGDSVVTCSLYAVHAMASQQGPPFAELHVDPNQPDSYSGERVSAGWEWTSGAIVVESADFQIKSDPTSNKHYIFPNWYPSQSIAFGAYLIVRRQSGTLDTIGNISGGTEQSPYQLKLIKHISPQPSFQSWNLAWRNVYRIPISDPDKARISICKGDVGAEDSASSLPYQETASGVQNYIEILGLDLYDSKGRKRPDGICDGRVYRVENEYRTLLIFPARRPFDSDTTFVIENGSTLPLESRVPNIYESSDGDYLMKNSHYFLRISTLP